MSPTRNIGLMSVTFECKRDRFIDVNLKGVKSNSGPFYLPLLSRCLFFVAFWAENVDDRVLVLSVYGLEEEKNILVAFLQPAQPLVFGS